MQEQHEDAPCIAKLINSAQQYAWGDTEGILPFIQAETRPGFPIGEVWLGSHERAPSLLLLEGGARPLDALILEDPRHWLGEGVAKHFHDMPYLFKVLAAGTPLSLQVHPNLAQAQEGFAREEKTGLPRSTPERTFKDPRHKPELAVALTAFTAMAGFRDPSEIAQLLGTKLAHMLDFAVSKSEDFRRFIRRLFSMRPEIFAAQLEGALTARATELVSATSERAHDAGALILELQKLYPHDPGQFGPLLFNIYKLRPGEGLFVPAGVIHAYVRGSILEIMACSDNVIRAGLTIKYVDVDLLCNILDPIAVPRRISPEVVHMAWGERAIYTTPAEEFRLECWTTRAAPEKVRIEFTPEGPEIFLCAEGEFTLSPEAAFKEESPSIRGETEGFAHTFHASQNLLSARQSCFIAGGCGVVRVEGRGTLWRAAIGGNFA